VRPAPPPSNARVDRFVDRVVGNNLRTSLYVLMAAVGAGRGRLVRQLLTESLVGIVADEKTGSLDSSSEVVYVPYAQSPIVGVSLLVKGAGDPATFTKAVQRAVWEINKNQAPDNVRTLEEIKSESVGSTRLQTFLLGLFATLALRTLLFETSPWDPTTMTIVGVVLALVALLACYVPPRRASRIDPMLALRHE
jgi:hypothetical protein